MQWFLSCVANRWKLGSWPPAHWQLCGVFSVVVILLYFLFFKVFWLHSSDLYFWVWWQEFSYFRVFIKYDLFDGKEVNWIIDEVFILTVFTFETLWGELPQLFNNHLIHPPIFSIISFRTKFKKWTILTARTIFSKLQNWFKQITVNFKKNGIQIKLFSEWYMNFLRKFINFNVPEKPAVVSFRI